MKKTLSAKMPKKNLIVEIISSLLLIFFVHSFISNFIQLQSLKNMLAFYTVHQSEYAWAIIISEFFIALLIFIPRTRSIGLILTLLFSFAAIITIIRTPHFPHDFGGIINDISKAQRFELLIALCILSFTGFCLKVLKSTPGNNAAPVPVVYT